MLKSTVVRDVVSLNEYDYISVTELGIFIDVNNVSPSNAYYSIVVKVEGNVTVVKLIQS